MGLISFKTIDAGEEVLVYNHRGEGSGLPQRLIVDVPDHDGGRPMEVNTWFIYNLNRV